MQMYVCVCRRDHRYIVRSDHRYVVRKETLQGMSENGMTDTIYVTGQYKLRTF